METKLLKLAIERLADQVEKLEGKHGELQHQVVDLKKGIASPHSDQRGQKAVVSEDELLTILEARTLLKVSKNSFLKLVERGELHAIRLNLRTIRYSKHGILDYIRLKSA